MVTKMKFNIAIPKIDLKEMPFFISYMICLLYTILSTTLFYQYINSLWKPVFIFCVGLLAVYEIAKRGVNWKNILSIGVIFLLFVNIVRIGQGMTQNAIAILMFYLFCARDISFKKISWYTILVSSISLIFIVGSSYLGIIKNYNYVGTNERHREFLGFLYALFGPTIMSNITLLWLYEKKEKITVKGAILFTALNLLFYIKTDSRLCFYLTVLILVFGLFLRKHSGFVLRRKLICYGMILSFVLAAILSYVMTISYDKSMPWMASLNSALGGRLSLGKESIISYGIKPFGVEGIIWVGNALDMYGKQINESYLVVDNYYIQVMQRFGYIYLMIILAFLTYACYRTYKKRDIYLLSIFCLIAIHSIFDNLYMYMHYNTFWLAAGIAAFSRGKRAKIENEVSIFAM